MEKLGRSIVRAAWILGIAIVLASAMSLVKYRYVQIGDGFYIDQTSGRVLMPQQEFRNQK